MDWATGVVPYGLLAALAGLTVVLRVSEGQSPVAELVLCALMAGWILALYTLRPDWRECPGVMAVFCAGLIVLLAVLVFRAPWFGFFTPAAYLFTFLVLRWPWRLGGVAAVSVVAGTAQAYGVQKGTPAGLLIYGAVVAANVLPLCLFAWYAWRSDQQNAERLRILAENAVLHEQLVAQAKTAGVHEERDRMAREIHDTLAQGLTGIISQLRAAEHAEPGDMRRHVVTAAGLARESLTEARRSVDALRPDSLRTARLGEALASVAERWSALHGVPVQVTTTGTVRPLRPEAEVALLRAAQEALANVARHARANRVGVTLSYLDEEVALDVRDDGSGFDPVRAGGFGLVAMRQRIEELSGTLRIESAPGAGAGISARVPVA
ncbi:sensor histidine kinase [Amycolatopsis albispora]|uniref:Oxygen sensor histidine kinase NreB n=1 Tax=Amycolatopsis albispora TaxID=1804986 RepID=A0A344L2Q8_9PSEU|nr:sensor histidine kinase [Amycolatopsis albispora]AXB42332.1 two-component sensor histidine kinase [Amycolatopsis albispora]